MNPKQGATPSTRHMRRTVEALGRRAARAAARKGAATMSEAIETVETEVDLLQGGPIQYVHVVDDAAVMDLELQVIAKMREAGERARVSAQFGVLKDEPIARFAGQWPDPQGGWIVKLVRDAIRVTPTAPAPSTNGSRG